MKKISKSDVEYLESLNFSITREIDRAKSSLFNNRDEFAIIDTTYLNEKISKLNRLINSIEYNNL